MNLLTVVNALNEARADADAGLLELVLELRGDMLVYGYKCSEAMNTRIITIKEIEQLRFVYDVVHGKCSEMIKEMIAHNINAKGQCMSNKKECLDASFAPTTFFSPRPPLVKQTAIKITERNGDTEKLLEFATADDYAAYRRIEAEPLMTDKQKYDAAVKSAREAAQSVIDEISKHTYWRAMCRQIKI